LTPSFGHAQHRARNLEIPGLVAERTIRNDESNREPTMSDLSQERTWCSMCSAPGRLAQQSDRGDFTGMGEKARTSRLTGRLGDGWRAVYAASMD